MLPEEPGLSFSGPVSPFPNVGNVANMAAETRLGGFRTPGVLGFCSLKKKDFV